MSNELHILGIEFQTEGAEDEHVYQLFLTSWNGKEMTAERA